MILKNKKLLILTSLLILLPIPVGLLLESRFPEAYMQSMGFTIWLPPLCLLAGHWLCILITAWDPGNKERNRKPMAMILWVIPVISNLLSGLLLALSLGLEFSVAGWTSAVMGVLFVIIGNYMPKTKMNGTIGIKIRWTYSSEENWNATHRYAGRIWFVGGIALLFGPLLPEMAAMILLFVVIAVMIALPFGYSYRFYRKEKAEGKEVQAGYPRISKKMTKGMTVFSVVLVLFLVAVMFTGDLEFRFGADALTVEADWYGDMTIAYDTVEAVEFRESKVPGTRIGGYSSARLLMGWFRNEEFGAYTRYTYTNTKAAVVLTVKGRTVVLSGESPEQTREIFEELITRTEK